MRGRKLILNERRQRTLLSKLTAEQRLYLGKLSRKPMPKKLLMESFGVSRTSVWFWGKQDLRTRFDIDKNGKGKI